MTVENVATQPRAIESREASLPRIVFSNTNLAEADFAHFAASPKAVGEFARGAGFDAVEWHPLYAPAALVGKAIAARELILNSLHQSSRTGWRTRGLADTVHGGASTRALMPTPFVGRFFMPEMARSASYMRTVVDAAATAIENTHGSDWSHAPVPGVFYPHSDIDEDMRIRSLAGAEADLAQPSDRLARVLGVQTVDAMTDELLEREYGYWFHYSQSGSAPGDPENEMPYILNTHEVRRRFGHDTPGPVSDLDTSLEHLAINANAIQIAVGVEACARSEPHIPTMDELKELLRGRATGQFKDILAACKEYSDGPLEYVAVSIPAMSIVRATGHHYADDVRKHYGDIAAALKAYFRTPQR